jgi:hypothetical protein
MQEGARSTSDGAAYYWLLLVVFISATIVSILRWDENYHLFILGLLAFAAASLGRTARRQRWSAWVKLHISGMAASYVLLLTGFYVDNGRILPLWREFPQWAFWVLPGAIGAPLIFNALLRHPLVQGIGDLTRRRQKLPRCVTQPPLSVCDLW